MLKINYDERRELRIGENSEEAILFAVNHWIETANAAIQKRGRFAVALSGGSTPNVIYQTLTKEPYAHQIDWSKVWLFWGDERAVEPDHPESNFNAAMNHGFLTVPLKPTQIFRMEAERQPIEEAASDYEAILKKHLDAHLFDLVMLGLGEDGHTASLFPGTKALEIEDCLVAPNWVEQKKCWRMTLTYPCICKSRDIVFYALGGSKQDIVKKVLLAPPRSPYPASLIGEKGHKALWILDLSAAETFAQNNP